MVGFLGVEVDNIICAVLGYEFEEFVNKSAVWVKDGYT